MLGPPGGRLARLSRERARPGPWCDDRARRRVLWGHGGSSADERCHAAGSWPIQHARRRLDRGAPHVDRSMCCGPARSTSTWDSFTVAVRSLQRRMWPQDRCASSWLRRLDGAAGLRTWAHGEARGRGCHGSSASGPVLGKTSSTQCRPKEKGVLQPRGGILHYVTTRKFGCTTSVRYMRLTRALRRRPTPPPRLGDHH